MRDRTDPFCPGPRVAIPGAPSGPLAGLRFAAKDLYDVAGQVTGAGNPDWARTHAPAAKTAPAIAALLEAGAELVGKTITDELAFSLEGRNVHFGTPLNPAARDRIPGGSSSGSASAVASGQVDFALGTDTGGSVRVPAAFCGLCGIRPSHGAISLDGVVPLAPSFDTVGWLAKDPDRLARVGEVLLPPSPPRPRGPLLLVEEALERADPAIREALLAGLGRLRAELAPAGKLRLEAVTGMSAEAWTETMRVLQGHEIHRTHGAWVESALPHLAPEIEARFRWAAGIEDSAAASAKPRREAFAGALADRLADGTVLCLPTTPTDPPALDATRERFRDYRDRTFVLTAIAGLARLPQVTLPLPGSGRPPVGLSLIAAAGADPALLELARRIGPELWP